VRRFRTSRENVADMVYDTHSSPRPEQDYCLIDPLDSTRQKVIKKGMAYHDLLVPIFRDGKLIYELPSLDDIRNKTLAELDFFNVGIKRFLNPHQYVVGMEKSLYDLKVELIRNIRSQSSHDYIMPEENE